MRGTAWNTMMAGAIVALLGGLTACDGATSTGSPNSGTITSVEGSATMWCMRSPEPYRCRARAGAEHQICAAKPANYDACRFAMDQMHGQ
jgi:hypothetical protein